MSSDNLVYKTPATRSLSSWLQLKKEGIEDFIVAAISRHQLRHDAPSSPEVTRELLEYMPHLPGRLTLTWPWTRTKPVDPTEQTVWIFDNTAFRVQEKQHQDKNSHPSLKAFPNDPVPPARWQAEYVVAYFSRSTFRDASHVIYTIAKLVGLATGTDPEQLRVGDLRTALDQTPIKKRLESFLSPILPKRTIRVSMGGIESQTLGPSTSSGISSGVHYLHFDLPPGSQIITIADSDWPPMWSTPAHTIFADTTGWGIISDIDDTIKVTETLSPVGVLKTTFIEEPQAVPGMPELYSHIQTRLGNPVFFYISASPYNLYNFLRSFRKQHFPDGTLILREASWQNLGGLISSLTLSVQTYKLDRLKKIHSWFPHREFICIGDSTQKDAESYGEMARRHPGWIKKIFIRRVPDPEGTTPTAAVRNSDKRFKRAFKGLDPSIWHVFDDPEEVKAKIDEMV